MPSSGALRAQLSSTLTMAYGRGLLSEQTFAMRLDSLLRDPVIDPERLVGDLYLRGSESTLRGRLSHTMSTAVGRIEALLGDSTQTPPTWLGLDWTGLKPELWIGRSSQCDIRLSDATISRRHARLRFRDGRWTLEDLNSTNGTAERPQSRALRTSRRRHVGPGMFSAAD